MLANNKPSARDLKIKTGVVKRIGKELLAYEHERIKQEARISALTSSDADEHDLKKQREVLEETTSILPDTQRRLADAISDLRATIESFIAANPDAASADDVIQAREMLDLHKQPIQAPLCPQ